MRQFDIVLEKMWVTPNPYFRLYTTQIGMNFTYSWKASKRYHKEVGVVPSSTEFANIAECGMIKEVTRLKSIESDMCPQDNPVVVAPSADSVSYLSNPVQYNSIHSIVLLENKK